MCCLKTILWLRSKIAHLERDMLKHADMEIIMPGTGFKPIHWEAGSGGDTSKTDHRVIVAVGG